MMNAADMRDRTSPIIRPSANHYLPTRHVRLHGTVRWWL